MLLHVSLQCCRVSCYMLCRYTKAAFYLQPFSDPASSISVSSVDELDPPELLDDTSMKLGAGGQTLAPWIFFSRTDRPFTTAGVGCPCCCTRSVRVAVEHLDLLVTFRRAESTAALVIAVSTSSDEGGYG